MTDEMRAVNWFETTCRRIRLQAPTAAPCAEKLTERLSALLLERLPPWVSGSVLGLLPSSVLDLHGSLLNCARGEAETSIGYPSFVQYSGYVMRTSGLEVTDTDVRQAVDAFLWSFANELPADLKAQLCELLPLELRSRMDLYSSISDDARVA